MIDISRSAGADTVKFVCCPDVDYEGSSRPGKDYVDVMQRTGSHGKLHYVLNRQSIVNLGFMRFVG